MLNHNNFSYTADLPGNKQIYQFVATDIKGETVCYFVMMDKRKKILFDGNVKRTKDDGDIDFEHYGQIVASCYGTKPTENIKLFLKEKYNFDV